MKAIVQQSKYISFYLIKSERVRKKNWKIKKLGIETKKNNITNQSLYWAENKKISNRPFIFVQYEKRNVKRIEGKTQKHTHTPTLIQILIGTANSFWTNTQLKRAYTNYIMISRKVRRRGNRWRKTIEDLLLLLSLLLFYFA